MQSCCRRPEQAGLEVEFQPEEREREKRAVRREEEPAGQLEGLSGPELAGERACQEQGLGLELAFQVEAVAQQEEPEELTFQGLEEQEAAQAFREQGRRASQGEDTE